MKKGFNLTLLHIALLLIVLGYRATAQFIYLPSFQQQPHSKSIELDNQVAQAHQQPLIMPAPDDGLDQSVGPMLSDVISIDRSISIFSGLTRSVEEVAARLEDVNQNTTVLAPKNSVITNLPHKPWEDPEDETEARAQGKAPEELYSGEGGEDRADGNLRKFVETHLIGISPWQKGQANKVKTLGGQTLWWDEKDGVKKIYPEGIEVEQVKDDVPNGQIWVIKDIIKT